MKYSPSTIEVFVGFLSQRNVADLPPSLVSRLRAFDPCAVYAFK
jgi:hypothetical protein